ncbi:SDR family oxidoreductase [Bacteroidota bacterium]
MEMLPKTVLVTGCTKGIGRALVDIFASHGYHVAGCARNKEDLTNLFVELSTRYPKQRFFFESCDAADAELLKIFGQDVLREFGSLDVLINNAGVFMPGSIAEEAPGAFEKQFQTNVGSAYHLSRTLLPAMKKAKSGIIINICSTAGITAYPNGGSYCISKFAMRGMSKVLREELKPDGIRVSTIIPGATLTNSWSGTDLPESRFMPVEDVAHMVYSICELSPRTVVEEIILRPQEGDIN